MFSLVACSSGNTGADGSAADSGTLRVKDDPVELVFYSTAGDFDEAGFMSLYGNQIKQKFPYITPKFIPFGKDSNLGTLITNGQTIDILFNSIGQTPMSLIHYGLQYDISDMIKKSNYDISRLEPTTIEIQKQLAGGAIYGLPVTTTSVSLYYNKDLFNKFGVAYPKDGMTWDDLYELAHKMSRTDGGVQYHGLGLSINHNMLLNQYSIPYIDPKTNKGMLTDNKFRSVFENLTRFFLIPGNEVDSKTMKVLPQQNLFVKDHTIAMFLALSDLGAKNYKDLVNWDVASMPVYKEKPGIGPQSYPNYFYVTKTGTHKDQAFQVIAYLTTDEFQRHLSRGGLFPVLKNTNILKEYGQDVTYLKDKHIQSFLPDHFAAPAPISEYQEIGQKYMTNAYYSVVQGQQDVNTALREAEENTNKDIATELAK
jgi:multiple sugar transport system substrate-binding protein